MDLRLTVREASSASGLIPSALLAIRVTFHPNAAIAGADPTACVVSGTVTTSAALPLAARSVTQQPVTFRGSTEESFGGAQRVVYFEQGDVGSPTSPSNFRGVLFIDVAAGPWFANGGAGRFASGDFKTY